MTTVGMDFFRVRRDRDGVVGSRGRAGGYRP